VPFGRWRWRWHLRQFRPGCRVPPGRCPPGGGDAALAFALILGDREVLVVANTHPLGPFAGSVVDRHLSRRTRTMRVAYSNVGTTGSGTVEVHPDARHHRDDGTVDAAPTAAVFVALAPMEVQVLVPD
jgi:hypothetical protein